MAAYSDYLTLLFNMVSEFLLTEPVLYMFGTILLLTLTYMFPIFYRGIYDIFNSIFLRKG